MGGTQIESNENLMTNGKPTFKTMLLNPIIARTNELK